MEKLVNIETYKPQYKQLWDDFITKSKNGLFQFYRNYMEYHQDRFEDHSLLFWNDKNQLIALLPAHKNNTTLASHLGLTFGGFITGTDMKTPTMLHLFNSMMKYLSDFGFEKFIYKTIPYIHHRIPAEEDRYALFRLNAKLYRRNVFSVVQGNMERNYQERRLRGVKKAQKANLEVRLTDDYSLFWPILTDVLFQMHQTKPVHTLAEITYLSSHFPLNIKLWGCYSDNQMLAGVVIYETDRVIRTQYIAASMKGRENAALDFIFYHLLENTYKDKLYFDFGPSDEENGFYLNEGLIDQKEGFGGRTVVHDHYEIDLKMVNYEN